MRCSHAAHEHSGTEVWLVLIVVSFERVKPVNDLDMKVEANTNPTNGYGFAMPFFELPKMAMPGGFREIAEQSVARVKENYERMKAASGEMADALRETCSTNAKGAADYGVRVIEISSVNATSAFDFLTNLMGTKSLSEIMELSAVQARKNVDVASAQNKELWDLAQKVAIETAEPIKKSVSRVLQKVT
jgi:phasin